jgi:hypothetical protein
MLKFSTGLGLAIMGVGGFGGTMDGGVIRLFSGTRPSGANMKLPAGNIQIATITSEGKFFQPGADGVGAGLRLRLRTNGYLENYGRWDIVPTVSGSPTWFRWNWAGIDPNDASTYFPRIDGDIGVAGSGADLILGRAELFQGTVLSIDLFSAGFWF